MLPSLFHSVDYFVAKGRFLSQTQLFESRSQLLISKVPLFAPNFGLVIFKMSIFVFLTFPSIVYQNWDGILDTTTFYIKMSTCSLNF